MASLTAAKPLLRNSSLCGGGSRRGGSRLRCTPSPRFLLGGQPSLLLVIMRGEGDLRPPLSACRGARAKPDRNLGCWPPYRRVLNQNTFQFYLRPCSRAGTTTAICDELSVSSSYFCLHSLPRCSGRQVSKAGGFVLGAALGSRRDSWRSSSTVARKRTKTRCA